MFKLALGLFGFQIGEFRHDFNDWAQWTYSGWFGKKFPNIKFFT
jgi:hypothetical protein